MLIVLVTSCRILTWSYIITQTQCYSVSHTKREKTARSMNEYYLITSVVLPTSEISFKWIQEKNRVALALLIQHDEILVEWQKELSDAAVQNSLLTLSQHMALEQENQTMKMENTIHAADIKNAILNWNIYLHKVLKSINWLKLFSQ